MTITSFQDTTTWFDQRPSHPVNPLADLIAEKETAWKEYIETCDLFEEQDVGIEHVQASLSAAQDAELRYMEAAWRLHHPVVGDVRSLVHP